MVLTTILPRSSFPNFRTDFNAQGTVSLYSLLCYRKSAKIFHILSLITHMTAAGTTLAWFDYFITLDDEVCTTMVLVSY